MTAAAPEDGGPGWLDAGRIPALDGARGVAIALVVLSHAGGSAGWRAADAGRPLSFGGLAGVDLFFVISGFLITTLLLREWGRGGLDLRAFYLRRCLRILPASYAYLIFVAALAAAGACRVPARDWAATLLYLTNFAAGPARAIAHFWSLSIEEQFYLAWPPLVAALLPRRGAAGAAAAAGAALALAAASRLLILEAAPGAYGPARWWTPCRLDGIAAGCLVAAAARGAGGVARLDRLARRWPLAVLACVALQVGGRRLAPGLAALVPTTEVAAMAGLLWRAMRAAPRWLDRGPLAALGACSYSIYLWQQPFLLPDRFYWWSTWPQNLPLALAAAAASRLAVERPFLALKARAGRPR